LPPPGKRAEHNRQAFWRAGHETADKAITIAAGTRVASRQGMRTSQTALTTRYVAVALTAALSATAIAAAVVTPVRAEQQRQRQPSILLESVDGTESFRRYCAPCHGDSGRGDGQVATALATKPADLTQLARRNEGLYPANRVRGVVTGDGVPVAAHGISEMPVWGPIFRALDSSDARVAIRIDNIVEYVGQLQDGGPDPRGLGARLFRTHCAACHGSDARGTGAVTGELRNRPPDLTKYTARNGGVFPRERVYRIIDGRYVTAHGDRDMPVWGDAFSRSREGLSEQEIQRRIEAIVGYLEAIQQRAAE
jgi:mono/diheme cytochrome c family protein